MPRLFYVDRECEDCPKALLEFGPDEDDLGEWVRTNLKIQPNDHVVKKGVEYVFRKGKLCALGKKDEALWDGESVPDEVLLVQNEHVGLDIPYLHIMNKRDEIPNHAFL